MKTITYSMAIQPLAHLREKTLAAFKANGGKRDRWSAHDQTLMADAITRSEDFAEIETPKNKRFREALKTIRRDLEIASETKSKKP